MASIARVKLRWTGFNGGPGYSIFHFKDFGFDDPSDWTNAAGASAADRIDDWCEGIRSIVAPPVRLKVESDIEIINEATGQLETVVSAGVRTEHSNPAPGAGGYSGASGAVVTWKTSGIRNGRRIRGRTFIVPCYAAAFGTDGTLSDGARTQVEASSQELIDAVETPDLGVYARPTGAGASDGVWHVVNTMSVPDMAAILRSRRD